MIYLENRSEENWESRQNKHQNTRQPLLPTNEES